MDSGVGTTKWQQAKTALNNLLSIWNGSGQIDFGFDVFPDFECESAAGLFCCDVTHAVVSDTAPDNELNIATIMMNAAAPTSKMDTPLCSGMDMFNSPTYAPNFTEGDGDRFLLVVSDGQEECNGSDFPTTCGSSPQYSGAVDVVSELLGNGIKTFVIGFGSGADPTQLNVIAANGGTDFNQYIEATDGTALQAAFEAIASAVVNCEFDVDWDSLEPGTSTDPNLVNFYCLEDENDEVSEDNIIFFDEGCADGAGWDWLDNDTVIFCDQACEMLKSGACAEVVATFGCDSVPIM